jgi:hypothetical protein
MERRVSQLLMVITYLNDSPFFTSSSVKWVWVVRLKLHRIQILHTLFDHSVLCFLKTVKSILLLQHSAFSALCTYKSLQKNDKSTLVSITVMTFNFSGSIIRILKGKYKCELLVEPNKVLISKCTKDYRNCGQLLNKKESVSCNGVIICCVSYLFMSLC